MKAPTCALRTILRTTSTLWPAQPPPTTTTATAPNNTNTPRLSHNYSQFTPSHIRPCSPSRSPSPPPPYSARNTTLLSAPNQWTRFLNSPSNTLSSVRTFSSTSKIRWPASPANSNSSEPAPTDPDAAQRINEVIDEIQELYGTARDEFEIAVEETEKNTTYAADDRAAAREELDKLLECYREVITGKDGAVAEEVKRRVGQRIRELESAVVTMEESAAQGD